ncbi:MAG: sirohydrochlorin cobaltochelatase [Pseudomonadota bacterium]
MSINRFSALLAALACALTLTLASIPAQAGHGDTAPARQAIVLAAFGTSYPEALGSILNIKTRVEQAHPGVPVRLAFTSTTIRTIWRKRHDDAAWRKANPHIPAGVLSVKTPLATIADLQNEGYRDIAVQSLHVFAGEEFADLKSMLIGLDSIRTIKAKSAPFASLRLGRPALGMPGDAYPYTDDIEAAVQALKGDADKARAMGAALVYMGHGNDFFSTGVYAELRRAMTQAHGVPVFAACVEGYPGFEEMMEGLESSGVKKVLLKPLMVVAGDHASNDMAGDDEDSWKVLLTEAGYTVAIDLTGLGSSDAWADLYVDHLKDALAQPGLLR